MPLLSTKLPWELAQPKWAATLNPVISLPLLAGNTIYSVSLLALKPAAINHLLQRLPVGWLIIDQDANADVWRAKPWTTTTLTLESSADVNLSLYIF